MNGTEVERDGTGLERSGAEATRTGEARRVARADEPHAEVGRGVREHQNLVDVVGERLRRETQQVFAAHTRSDQAAVRWKLAYRSEHVSIHERISTHITTRFHAQRTRIYSNLRAYAFFFYLGLQHLKSKNGGGLYCTRTHRDSRRRTEWLAV